MTGPLGIRIIRRCIHPLLHRSPAPRQADKQNQTSLNSGLPPPVSLLASIKCADPNVNHPQFNQLFSVVFKYSTHFTTFWVILLTNRQTKTQHKSKHYPRQAVADAVMKETKFARNKPAADCMHKHHSLLPHCLQTDKQWYSFDFLETHNSCLILLHDGIRSLHNSHAFQWQQADTSGQSNLT